MDNNFIKNSLFYGALNDRVRRLQNNEERIDDFVDEYRPFILSTVRKCTRRDYITESDDEYSIALIAFVEAIKAHRGDKGNFLTFAKNVIKMRCIDYYRKESRHAGHLSLDGSENNGNIVDLTRRQSQIKHESDMKDRERALEIAQFKAELAKWGISLSDLVQASPKQAKTRKMCREVICYLYNDHKKIEYIFDKKMLPLAGIEKDTGVPRKQLERLRKYIIATLIIKNGDYQFLSEYVADRGCHR